MDIIEFLCYHFRDAVHLRNGKTETPLHKAAQTGDRASIARLLAAGAVVNAVTDHGNTPLHKAACAGVVDGLDLLRAALPQTNQIGYSPIHIAVQHGHHATLQRLLEYATQEDIERTTNDNDTPLVLAIIYGYLPCISLLLAHGASTETGERQPSLLKHALTHRHTRIAHFLLAHGVPITSNALTLLQERSLSPNQSYVQFLEETKSQLHRMLSLLDGAEDLPDVLSKLITAFCLSSIKTTMQRS